MIYLFSGTPGSGKSVHLAEEIIKQVKKKKPCIANFPVCFDNLKFRKGLNPYWYFYETNNHKIDPDGLKDFAFSYWENKHSRPKEGELLLIIDEAQILFNARSWMQKDRISWLEFFTQHRKYGYDVILTCQFDDMLDKQIRSLIEYEIIHRKISNFGLIGAIASGLFLGNLFIRVCMWYPIKERLHSNFFVGRKKFYSLYDTFADFDKST